MMKLEIFINLTGNLRMLKKIAKMSNRENWLFFDSIIFQT